MKRSTIISVGLILLGFVFEYLYLAVDNLFFDVKFFILGVACIVAGVLGLWIYAVMPAMGKSTTEEESSSKHK